MSKTLLAPAKPPPPFSREALLTVLLIMILHGFYAVVLIYNSSVFYQGQRWFCLLDDAMISMRYARNLAKGLGLVWNAGERVEGLTNPAWTLVMALVHLIEPNRAYTSLYIQIISWLCIAGTALVAAKLAWRLSGGSIAVATCTAAVTGFYYPLNYFSIFGMETGVLALLITSAAASFLYKMGEHRFPIASYMILGLATLIRIDMAVPLIVMGGYGVMTSGVETRSRYLCALLITLLVFVGGQTVARLIYYGYPVPNTYYLKMTGFPVLLRVTRGIMVTGTALGCLGWPVMLLGITWLLCLRGKGVAMLRQRLRYAFQREKTHPVVLLVLLFAGQAAYSVYVGGDAWEWLVFCNRYMVVAIPLLMIPYFMLVRNGLKALRVPLLMPKNAFAKMGVTLVLAALSVVLLNSHSFKKEHRGEIYLTKKPLIADDNRVVLLSVALLQSAAGAKVKVASDCAGAIPYFIDAYAVDPLGKCDEFIGHLPVPNDHWLSDEWYNAYYPGHMKWDADYTWKKYHPEYMAIRWPVAANAFASILEAHYVSIPDVDGNRYVWKKR